LKSDIDRLMQERGFDALVVTGPSGENLPLQYLGNGAKITSGTIIKKRGETPLLLHGSMEREEAARSGLPTADFNDFGLMKALKETKDRFQASLIMYQNAFEELGVEGTVAFYGRGDVGRSHMLLQALGEMLPHIDLVGETGVSLFEAAFATKDSDEFERIKSVAGRTTETMGETIYHLQRHAVQEKRLVQPDGKPLTIGDVKNFIALKLAERGLEAPEEVIFAQGRDGGIPHSRGDDDAPVEIGIPIVFDLFPREAGGGYYHDMTRTICLGFASDEVTAAYNDVMQCFKAVVSSLSAGQSAGDYQAMACEFFEARGHPTIKSNPGTQEGYVHSLGHGVGLELHGYPRLSDVASDDVFEPGNVFTVEPGLYYPDRGYGIRIEDVMYFGDDGKAHSLTRFSKDLVIPIA
jgi:Xaa-Pro aminopeptidase